MLGFSGEEEKNGQTTAKSLPSLCPKKNFCTKIDKATGKREYGTWPCRAEQCGTSKYASPGTYQEVDGDPNGVFFSACSNRKKIDGINARNKCLSRSNSAPGGEFVEHIRCQTRTYSFMFTHVCLGVRCC